MIDIEDVSKVWRLGAKVYHNTIGIKAYFADTKLDAFGLPDVK